MPDEASHRSPDVLFIPTCAHQEALLLLLLQQSLVLKLREKIRRCIKRGEEDGGEGDGGEGEGEVKVNLH